MTTTQTPGGAAGVQTPRPPMIRKRSARPFTAGTRRPPATHPEALTPCRRAPHLFELDATTPVPQVKAALWLCQQRCPALEWCRTQESPASHVTAGTVVDTYGRVYSSADTYFRRKKPSAEQRAKLRPRECKECGSQIKGGASNLRYCGDPCRLVVKRRQQQVYDERHRAADTERKRSVRKTCSNGHPWTEANTGQRANGSRLCMTCRINDLAKKVKAA